MGATVWEKEPKVQPLKGDAISIRIYGADAVVSARIMYVNIVVHPAAMALALG